MPRTGCASTRAKVVKLVKKDLSDRQIATQLKLTRRYVGQLRLEAKIKRPGYRKWTREAIIEKAQWWFKEFGALSANDWNVGYLRAQNDQERLKRFYKHGAPHLNSVRLLFGQWSEMKRQAGLPESRRGNGVRNPKPKAPRKRAPRKK